MKHHIYNPDFQFVVKPEEFNKSTDRELLQFCLGATLYMPGTMQHTDKVLARKMSDVTSMVMCLEDAIKESSLIEAEKNVFDHLSKLSDALKNKTITQNDIPLTFVRVRNPEQFSRFAQQLSPEHAVPLSGIVFPKFYSHNALQYLDCLADLNQRLNMRLYGMPILEGSTIAYKETRLAELIELKKLLKPYKQMILNVRVGGTDFSSIFGVRRGIDYSIYEILAVKDCLADILNIFNRADDSYIVSSPVWEYFLAHKKDNLETLLEDNIHRSLLTRTPILNEAIDGLLREVVLDKANGFVGKTIIHPSHARFVNAMQAITKEEYDDAKQILSSTGGVAKSTQGNKMNEANPHKNWALKIVNRARAYGVIKNENLFFKLISGNNRCN